MRSQLTFYKESIRQPKQPRPRFHPAFRLLWVLLSRVRTGWKSAAELMKPKTVLQWHEHAFLQWWRWKSRRKGGRPTIHQEMRALIRVFESRECPVECRNSPGRAFCCDGASDSGKRCLLFVPRQRRNLRRRGGPFSRGNWDCRSQNGSPMPLAKSIRGKVWRYATARVIGSRGDH